MAGLVEKLLRITFHHGTQASSQGTTSDYTHSIRERFTMGRNESWFSPR
jgi:hypothetical protein